MTVDQDKHEIITVAEISPASTPWARRAISALRAQYHRPLFVPVLVLAVLLIGGSILFYRVGHPSKDNSANAASQSAAARAALLFPPASLVFQNLQGGPPATNSTTTIVRSDGAVQRQFSSSYSNSAFDEYAGSMAPFSSGLLLSNQLSDGATISVTKWSDLHANGQITSVASTLTPTLNNIWNGNSIIDGQLFIVGADTLYGVFTNAAYYNLQKFDLQTGIVRTALQIKPLSGVLNNNDVQPKNMSANQTDISFVMNNVLVNGDTISTPSIVVYTVATGKIKVIALPARLAGMAPSDPAVAPIQYTISADGTLIAYAVSRQGAVNGTATTVFSTHVYNTQTGKDVAVSSGPSINLGACIDPFYFSNDDTYLVTCGSVSLIDDAIIEITNTKTGAVVRTFDVGNAANYSIVPVGWSANDELVYVTNSTANGTAFNAAAEEAHSVSLTNDSTHDYPSGLGELLMVMH